DAPMVGTFHAAGTNLAYTYVPWLTRRMAKKLRVRIAVSEQARDSAMHSLGGNYELLFNGVETDRYRPTIPVGERVRAVLFVGRHEHRKGLDVLIEAMRVLPADVELWIGGSGPQTAELQSSTKGDPRIIWLGRLTDAEKVERMRKARVFCAPS